MNKNIIVVFLSLLMIMSFAYAYDQSKPQHTKTSTISSETGEDVTVYDTSNLSKKVRNTDVTRIVPTVVAPNGQNLSDYNVNTESREVVVTVIKPAYPDKNDPDYEWKKYDYDFNYGGKKHTAEEIAEYKLRSEEYSKSKNSIEIKSSDTSTDTIEIESEKNLPSQVQEEVVLNPIAPQASVKKDDSIFVKFLNFFGGLFK